MSRDLVFLSSTETVNVALKKPAYQCSVYTSYAPCPFDAPKAVDGDRTSNIYACHCSHTRSPNWWAVDLLEVYTMDYVDVYNRNEVPERLNNFWVGFTNVDVSKSNPQRGLYPLCGQYPGKMTLNVVGTVKCNYNLPPARYLIIQMDLNGLDGMAICEVEAFPLDHPSEFQNSFLWKAKLNLTLSGFSYYEWQYKGSVHQCIRKCLTSSTRCDSFNENPNLKSCIFNLHPFGFNVTSLHLAQGWKFWTATHA